MSELPWGLNIAATRKADVRSGSPSGLAWPLDEDALEELRWYLEDYLRAPCGVYEDRGRRLLRG